MSPLFRVLVEGKSQSDSTGRPRTDPKIVFRVKRGARQKLVRMQNAEIFRENARGKSTVPQGSSTVDGRHSSVLVIHASSVLVVPHPTLVLARCLSKVGESQAGQGVG